MSGPPYYMMPGGMPMMPPQRPGMYPNMMRPAVPMPLRPFMPIQMGTPMAGVTTFRPPASLLVKPPAPPLNPSTIYVGRIPEDVEDLFITSVLIACGPVTKWKRLADPDSGKLKSFGFCEYDNPLSALRALRLLKNIEIDGSKLLLNVDTKTQEVLDAFEANYKNSQTAQQDEAALLRISQLLDERAVTHPPKPKEVVEAEKAAAEAEDKAKKSKSPEKRKESRKRDRSRSREKRRRSSRSRSKDRSSKKRSRDRRDRRSRGRDRRRSSSRTRSRGRRDRKSRRHSRSRSKSHKSKSPKRKKKSVSKSRDGSDSEEAKKEESDADKSEKETEREKDKSDAESAAGDESPPPPPPPSPSALFTRELDWDKIQASGIIEAEIRPWMEQEIERHVESMGRELASYVVESLESRKSAVDLQSELVSVLGTDGSKKIVSDLWTRLSQ